MSVSISLMAMVSMYLVFDDKIYVKRLQMIPDKLLVISDNQIYREWGITSENEHRFMVFGKVLISQSQTLKRHN